MHVSAAPSAEHRLSPHAAETLWRSWRTTRDVKARDRLVLSYAPMVRYLATRKVRAIPSHHDLDDLVSCGLVALIAAVDRFDPDRGATFEQFAWTRVAGAMVDELRRLDWAPRSVRRQERETNQARERYQRREGRLPTEQELAATLGISRQALRDRLGEVERADIFSLSTTVRSADSSSAELGETIEAPVGAGDPESELLAGERVQMLRQAIESLPPREREVFTLVHVHRARGAEVGCMYGVSESRVSQILASARERVRVALETYDSLGTAA